MYRSKNIPPSIRDNMTNQYAAESSHYQEDIHHEHEYHLDDDHNSQNDSDTDPITTGSDHNDSEQYEIIVWSLERGEKIVVHFNARHQPIKKGGQILSSWLGKVTKRGNLCPLNYTDWKKVSPSYKKDLVILIRRKFQYPMIEAIEKILLRMIGKKWMDYRYVLKRDHVRNKTKQQVLSNNVPKGVDQDQWKQLVNYWFSEQSEKYSTIRTATRERQQCPHTSGSKSFARRRDEYEMTHGNEPGCVEFFAKTHKHEDETFIDDASRQFMVTAEARVAELVAASGSSDASNNLAIQNEVFTELMGEESSGRVRDQGFGVTPSAVYGLSAQMRNDMGYHGAYAKEINSLRAQIEENNQQHAQQIQQITARHDDQMNNIQSQMDELKSLLQHLVNRGPHD